MCDRRREMFRRPSRAIGSFHRSSSQLLTVRRTCATLAVLVRLSERDSPPAGRAQSELFGPESETDGILTFSIQWYWSRMYDRGVFKLPLRSETLATRKFCQRKFEQTTTRMTIVIRRVTVAHRWGTASVLDDSSHR